MSPAPARFPPAPAGPALWHTLRYLAQPQTLFEECHRKYGDIFSLSLLGTGRWVFLAAVSPISLMSSSN